jgi:hypothetical protein
MNPIVFALRHPITTLMLVVALVGGGALALTRMRIDIFPPINQPQVFVFVNYGVYDPGQMEGLLVSQFELWFQYVGGVRNIESKSIQQVAVVKLSFYPDTDMSKAMGWCCPDLLLPGGRRQGRADPGAGRRQRRVLGRGGGEAGPVPRIAGRGVGAVRRERGGN